MKKTMKRTGYLPVISLAMILLTGFAVHGQNQARNYGNNQHLIAEAIDWSRQESENLHSDPLVFLKFSSDAKEKRLDFLTFTKMLKKDVELCSRESLKLFNEKLGFAAGKYPILDLNYLCYESEYPGIGFYNRSLLVVSSKTVEILTDEEFLGAVGHELGHSFFVEEMSHAILEKDFAAQKLIELKCDIIGLALLKYGGVKNGNSVYISVLNKYDELLKNVVCKKDSYVSKDERVAFIEAVSLITDQSKPPAIK